MKSCETCVQYLKLQSMYIVLIRVVHAKPHWTNGTGLWHDGFENYFC